MVLRLYDPAESHLRFFQSTYDINTHGDRAQLKEAIATSPLSGLSRLASLFSLAVVCPRHDNRIRIFHREELRERLSEWKPFPGKDRSIITKITFISSVLRQWVILARSSEDRNPLCHGRRRVAVRKLPASMHNRRAPRYNRELLDAPAA